MRIIFTDKLSKMVAYYENLRDMIFELNTSFDINTSWDFGEESTYSISWTRPTGRKNPERNSKRYQQPEWSSS